MTKCDQCGGKGYIELEHGLIQLRCVACKGKGDIFENDNDNGNGTGIDRTGQPIDIAGGEAPREYRKPRKSKVGRSTTKRHG